MLFRLSVVLACDGWAGVASSGSLEPWFDTKMNRPTIVLEIVTLTMNELLRILRSRFIKTGFVDATPEAPVVLI